MGNKVDVTIPVQPEAAAALADREAAGRPITGRPGPSLLAHAIAQLKAEVKAAGLTDLDIDAELATYNTESRNRRPAGLE